MRAMERRCSRVGIGLMALALLLAVPAVRAQTSGQSQPPANVQAGHDLPDAPSTVQPPPPKPAEPEPATQQPAVPAPAASNEPAQPREQTDLPSTPAVEPAPEGSATQTSPPANLPRNQIDPKENLFKISVSTSFVQIPVMVKDESGRRVDGLLPKDFTVNENGKPQTLTYFTSDPFELSVAFVLDIGMADVALQKVHETYSALTGALSPYDEGALYTYSSTVSQVSDFTGRADKLSALLNELKLVRGHNNGPPVLNGPMASGPTVNGMPVGGPAVHPANTPPKEAHVLNDASLRAALDLGKRDRTRRKVIFVISDGREFGSEAGYSDVLKVLQTRDIQVKAVVVDSGALPGFRQLEKIHLKGQGYGNILPKYSSATGGGAVYSELSRNAIEEAYAQITSEARNQYTLGYRPKATAGSSAYRSVEVVVHRKGLKVSAKDGYYPIASAR